MSYCCMGGGVMIRLWHHLVALMGPLESVAYSAHLALAKQNGFHSVAKEPSKGPDKWL